MSFKLWTRFVEPSLVVRHLVLYSLLTRIIRQDSKGNPTCNTFVLKIQSSKSCHKNELNAFTYFRSPTFGPGPSPNIVKFYGSFIQNGLGCMILEYVDGPNLLNYLTDTEPPESPTDRLLFWKSYWGLFEGLHRIHQVADLRTKGAFLG